MYNSRGHKLSKVIHRTQFLLLIIDNSKNNLQRGSLLPAFFSTRARPQLGRLIFALKDVSEQIVRLGQGNTVLSASVSPAWGFFPTLRSAKALETNIWSKANSQILACGGEIQEEIYLPTHVFFFFFLTEFINRWVKKGRARKQNFLQYPQRAQQLNITSKDLISF